MHTQSDLEEKGKRDHVFIDMIKEVTDTHFILKWNSYFKNSAEIFALLSRIAEAQSTTKALTLWPNSLSYS